MDSIDAAVTGRDVVKVELAVKHETSIEELKGINCEEIRTETVLRGQPEQDET